MWKAIAKNFQEIWNLPYCIAGAIDGKHVPIKSTLHSGSLYFNYKVYFSIILMAICDVHYIFMYIDIGSSGSNNGSDVFGNSKMGNSFSKIKFIYQRLKA